MFVAKALQMTAFFGFSALAGVFAMQFFGAPVLYENEVATLDVSEKAQAEPEMALELSYDLAKLQILETTLYHVEESYVDPSRLDYERMYVQALEAVERRVPVCMFQRAPAGRLLHVEIGEFRTVLEVEPVSSRLQLQRALREVAGLMKEHMTQEDIPLARPSPQPFAHVEYALINGMLGTLDPHSVLLPPSDSKEMDVENQGEFGGLGITIVLRDGKLTIEYPLKGTPAEEVGLQADDHIVRIDGESTINLSLEEAVARLRGPVGKPVLIQVMRDGLSEPLEINIVRRLIQMNPVEGQLLEGGIGYVSIKSFHANVQGSLRATLNDLTEQSGGLTALILDLRGNPGGFLNQAVAVADMFLERGVIVSTVDRGQRKREVEVAHVRGTEAMYPMVVLVNANSASASEIVAGALRNNHRAAIIGERTFGKGSVQNLHSFYDESKLKLTVAKYLTPGENSIQSIGIPADIELIPSIIEAKPEPVAEAEETPRPYALLFWRDRVRREADLDKHLEKEAQELEEASYELRFVQKGKRRRRSAEVDLADDFQVQFARQLLIAAPYARRGELLAGAAAVVAEQQEAQNKSLEVEFEKMGIDWTTGERQGGVSLEVQFDLGEDDALLAGEEEIIGLEVTNLGSSTLFRLSAISESEDEILDGREFFFGKLEPGKTARYEHRVRVVDGYPTQLVPVSFVFGDATGSAVVEKQARLPVTGKALPAMSWNWSLRDTAPGGDGDGLLEKDETLTFSLSVENEGPGEAGEPFARLKNYSGRSVELVNGTVEFKDLEQGVPSTDAFAIELRETTEPYELELVIGDEQSYDHASIVRGGFYSYFTNKEKITFKEGAAEIVAQTRKPPTILVTRQPGLVVEQARVTVSGLVTDDKGVADVMVFAGDNKVFYQGSRGEHSVRSVPFTADIELDAGANTLSILVKDNQGLTTTKSVVTFYLSAELAKKSQELTSPESPTAN
jgi:carboxyl-terminal processing protease